MEFDASKMDAAARRAKDELNTLSTADEVAKWFAKWYMQAGHKRLGRVLVEYARRT